MKYARCVGFCFKKDDVGCDAKSNINRQYFACNRAGLRDKKHYMRIDRKREHRLETRTNYKARLVVHVNTIASMWKVSKSEEGHNLELTPLKYVHLIPKYYQMTNVD